MIWAVVGTPEVEQRSTHIGSVRVIVSHIPGSLSWGVAAHGDGVSITYRADHDPTDGECMVWAAVLGPMETTVMEMGRELFGAD